MLLGTIAAKELEHRKVWSIGVWGCCDDEDVWFLTYTHMCTQIHIYIYIFIHTYNYIIMMMLMMRSLNTPVLSLQRVATCNLSLSLTWDLLELAHLTFCVHAHFFFCTCVTWQPLDSMLSWFILRSCRYLRLAQTSTSGFCKLQEPVLEMQCSVKKLKLESKQRRKGETKRREWRCQRGRIGRDMKSWGWF